MAVTDRLRTRLTAVAPATSGRLTEAEFLLAGATVGALGWGGTQTLAWLDPPNAALGATALWVVLVGAFSGTTVLHGPDAVRFSDAMFVWGAVNGTAMGLTLTGLAGLVPEPLAFWHAWVGAAAVGYCWTAGLLEGPGHADRGRAYLVSGVVALAVLLIGSVRFSLVEPVAFLLLGALHVVPLVFDARRRS
ncbi:hypothetical protein NDI85_06870 [Halomicroarcula sp. S1AR25-4]|uniref:hypothetical protein n=1 Tax=Haloarcula sp. S1AR25-4 TaxID=2950538 RepID=UPI00287513F6|nr:hypothetical protein [Halomicroarcula sp. S1AR25-4]MDS0277510.1 hypothetical protein [Halomicroarcula sp. S1AR25-4]